MQNFGWGCDIGEDLIGLVIIECFTWPVIEPLLFGVVRGTLCVLVVSIS